jgi:hypothetical protein
MNWSKDLGINNYTLQKTTPPQNFYKQKPTLYKPNQQTIYFLNLPYEISIQIDYQKRKNRMNERINDLEKKVKFLEMFLDMDQVWWDCTKLYVYVYDQISNERFIEYDDSSEKYKIKTFYY